MRAGAKNSCQPRSLRPSPGLVVCEGQGVPASRFRDAWALQVGAASTLRRLVVRILVHADDDGCAPPVRSGHNCVHPVGDPTGRERPYHHTWPGLFELPEVGSHARSTVLGRGAHEPVGVFRCIERGTTREQPPGWHNPRHPRSFNQPKQ